MDVIDSARRMFNLYIRGIAPASKPEAEVRSATNWDGISKKKRRRLLTIQLHRLDVARVNLNKQFDKNGPLMTLLVLLLGFVTVSTIHGAYRLVILPVGLAAVLILWAQSPRFKVFRAQKEEAPQFSNSWDEYWYYYQRRHRCDYTLVAVERLELVGTLFAIVAIMTIVIVVLSS